MPENGAKVSPDPIASEVSVSSLGLGWALWSVGEYLRDGNAEPLAHGDDAIETVALRGVVNAVGREQLSIRTDQAPTVGTFGSRKHAEGRQVLLGRHEALLSGEGRARVLLAVSALLVARATWVRTRTRRRRKIAAERLTLAFRDLYTEFRTRWVEAS